MSRLLRASQLIGMVGLLAAARGAFAQQLRGTVRDSADSQPIPGVVLMLLDANGTVLGRNITNERGEFRVALSAGIQHVRLVRIGFRPREAAIPALDKGVAHLDLAMLSLPTMLEPVRVEANARCPSRKDADAALALLEQARAGLLATIVARDANPSTLVRLRFERNLDDDRIVLQRILKDSVVASTKSFTSVRNASEFISQGFLADSGGKATFFGPDAEVLLDHGFSTGYCFGIADNDKARPTQIGLKFFPVERRRARVDIEGTLWIDTVARALRDIDYRYLGLDPRTNSVRPGGLIAFREMANGVVLIDRWSMRLPKRHSDTSHTGSRDEISEWFQPLETGGELAHAIWADGFTWNASLGSVRGVALTEGGKAASGMIIKLANTPYRAVVDSTGHFEMSDLAPGPYDFAATDGELARLGLEIPIAYSMIAVRDSIVHPSFAVRTAHQFIQERCVAKHRFKPGDSPFLVGRAVSENGKSVNGVRVVLRDSTGSLIGGDTYKLESNGVFEWCNSLEANTTVTVQASVGGRVVGTATRRLDKDVNTIVLLVTPPLQ